MLTFHPIPLLLSFIVASHFGVFIILSLTVVKVVIAIIIFVEVFICIVVAGSRLEFIILFIPDDFYSSWARRFFVWLIE